MGCIWRPSMRQYGVSMRFFSRLHLIGAAFFVLIYLRLMKGEDIKKMEKRYRETSFFQAAQNIKKFGAYYTDLWHCERIGMLFDFDTADEICVLEPSAGDASAVFGVTGRKRNCKIYAVEIQKETYENHLKGNENLMGALNEDFLRGVKISHGVFSFCFANPPYGEEKEESGSKRLELLFLERISWYLKTGGYLAYVVPYTVFADEKFFRAAMTRYEICSYYRFDEKEYEKYHQVVVIMRKKHSGQRGYLRSAFEKLYEKALCLDEYPYLPENMEQVIERYEVLPSKESDIEYFASMKFNPEEAVENLRSSSLYEIFSKDVFQKKYSGCDLSRPIVPVSKDISYLLAVSGGGQGLAGNEDEGTLHLQRGVARKAEEDSQNLTEDGKVISISSRSYTKIHLNIIENDGKITQL